MLGILATDTRITYTLKRIEFMMYKSRPLAFPIYRLFSVVLAFTVAFVCLGQSAMEYLYGFCMIPADPPVTHDAILGGCIISGMLSMFFGFIMLRIMMDRRVVATDRRQRQLEIDFPDRRTNSDRRTC